MNSFRGICYLLLFILVACKSNKTSEQVSPANEIISIEKIKLKDMNGGVVKWEKYRGRTLVIAY